MIAKPDLLYPFDVFHEDPKVVVRIVVDGVTKEEWVYGVGSYYSEYDLENGILDRACDCASCSCVRTDTLSKVEARLVDPNTAQCLAEYRYVPEEITFQRI